jgi:hypothetical protein
MRPGERGSRGDSFLAVGVDVGGTKIAAGVVSFPRGRVESIRVVRRARSGEETPCSRTSWGSSRTCAIRPGARPGGRRRSASASASSSTGAGPSSARTAVDWTRAQVVERLSRVCARPRWKPTSAPRRSAEALCSAPAAGSIAFSTRRSGRASAARSCSTASPYLGSRGLTGTLASAPIPCAGGAPLSTAPSTLEELASGPGLVARWNRASRAPRGARRGICSRRQPPGQLGRGDGLRPALRRWVRRSECSSVLSTRRR